MQNICLQLHMETLQHLPLIYRPAFRAALKTRSPSSLPCGIALTSHMRMRRENGYGEMDIYHAEHITISSFRSIRLHTQTIFQPLFKARLSGDFFFFFFFCCAISFVPQTGVECQRFSLQFLCAQPRDTHA